RHRVADQGSSAGREAISAASRSRAAAVELQALARRALSDTIAAGPAGPSLRLYAAQLDSAHALHRKRRARARQQSVGVADPTGRDGPQSLPVYGLRARR